MSELNINSLGISGGVNFYESPVKIEKSKFVRSKSEDALNLIRSKFTLNSLEFVDIYSDALDVDFSDGTILNSNFINVGNDSIDISGSNVIAKDIIISASGDKAISIGERSNFQLSRSLISASSIGIASNDFSKVFVTDLKTNKLKICLAAYQKKNEYGPGYIKIGDPNNECQKNIF